jgi:hypothetical protein
VTRQSGAYVAEQLTTRLISVVQNLLRPLGLCIRGTFSPLRSRPRKRQLRARPYMGKAVVRCSKVWNRPRIQLGQHHPLNLSRSSNWGWLASFTRYINKYMYVDLGQPQRPSYVDGVQPGARLLQLPLERRCDENLVGGDNDIRTSPNVQYATYAWRAGDQRRRATTSYLLGEAFQGAPEQVTRRRSDRAHIVPA